MKHIGVAILLALFSSAGYAEVLQGLCMVSANHNSKSNTATADLMLHRSDCGDETHECESSENSNIAWSRWTGVSAESLNQQGAQLNGQMNGDAGELRCSGTVHDGVLAGRYQFTPNPAFVQKMTAMGFDGVTTRKQESFLMLDVTTAWVAQIKDAGVTELSTNKLMGLRALHVDLDYIRGISGAGYPELRANRLTEMKAVGVTPEKAREARALGFQPTEQQLIEMSIFKIDRPFVERMRARGLQNLTLEKLIKVKTFKLED